MAQLDPLFFYGLFAPYYLLTGVCFAKSGLLESSRALRPSSGAALYRTSTFNNNNRTITGRP